MGVFSVAIEVGDPGGGRFERVEAVVDTGASYTQLPASTLRRLGVQADEKRTFVMADGRREQSDIGQTWARLNGIPRMIMVVFAEEGTQALIGAVTLQEFGLGIDTVGEKLIPVPGYRLHRRACP
jgi:predicted aspartyl protease